MANVSIPQIYDRNMNRLAYLQNATSVGYNMKLNELWTASFSLPTDDPKNQYCQSLNYVEIYDGQNRVDLFRIIGQDLNRSNDAYTSYNCEHVLATLMNDVLFQYHQVGGNEQKTADIITYVLQQQTTVNWQLDICDFERRFEYSWENENLLSALFAIPQCFDEEYLWTWDTTVYPWRLALRVPPNKLASEIRYRKNMIGMQRTKDDTQIINRVYALGYGEGVNQLTISEINGGVPYVENIASQQEYGLISSIIVDTRYTVVENLKGYAEQVLSEASQPYISYKVDAIDLFRIKDDDSGHFKIGDVVRVYDDPDNITLRTRIVNISKSDVRGDPASVTITLANKTLDISGSITDLQNRTLINQTYAQGATNLSMVNFADNADESHPARLRVYIPNNAVRINQANLSIDLESFRSYSMATAGGGASSDTTEGGGGLSSTTEGGGGITQTSSATELLAANARSTDTGGIGSSNHNHGINSGTRLAIVNNNNVITGGVSFGASGAHTHGEHDHEIELPDHMHDFEISPHTHMFSLPDHTHEIEAGIYEGEIADSVEISVDNGARFSVDELNDINIVNDLSKDDSGKITRGTWHTIDIYPNKITRIVAAVALQLFVNSQGGGNY